MKKEYINPSSKMLILGTAIMSTTNEFSGINAIAGKTVNGGYNFDFGEKKQ